MNIGVTGHQARPSIDWAWVRSEIQGIILSAPSSLVGYSSLAAGADQIFAEEILKAGGSLVAVIPLPNYDESFEADALRRFQELAARATIVRLPGEDNVEQSFFTAGKYVVDHVDELIAVWDGLPAHGLGGTADIVEYAQGIRRPVVHINTSGQSVSRI